MPAALKRILEPQQAVNVPARFLTASCIEPRHLCGGSTCDAPLPPLLHVHRRPAVNTNAWQAL